MPLNVQNKEYIKSDEENQPKPIIHQPKQGYSSIKYFLMGLFIVVVVASAVFLIYLLSFNLMQGPQPTKQVYTTEVGEAEKPAEAKPTEMKPPVSTEITPIPQPSVKLTTGLLTVYIGSYVMESTAREEVGRWIDAGFNAAVVHANNHYRVALGNYTSVDEAKKFADQMWEAFEYGYWIGKVE